jgi:hypothetical protein
MRTFFHTWDDETSADGDSWQDVGQAEGSEQLNGKWFTGTFAGGGIPFHLAQEPGHSGWPIGAPDSVPLVRSPLISWPYIPCQHRLRCQDGIDSLPRACAWRHDQSSLPLCPLPPQQIISPSLGGVVADVLRIIRPGFRLPFRLRPLQRVASPVWMWKLAPVSIESFSENGTPILNSVFTKIWAQFTQLLISLEILT